MNKPENDPPCPKCGSTNTNSPYWGGNYRGCFDCGTSWNLGQPINEGQCLEKVWSALAVIREDLARLQKSIDNILALKEAK